MAKNNSTKISFLLCTYAVLLVFGYFFLMLCAVFIRLFFDDQNVPGGMIVMNLPIIGPTKVPHHYFALFACAFSFVMTIQILKWVKKFEQNLTIDFPVIATCCLFVLLILLLLSCWLSQFWLLLISFFWVTCMTMDASCRYSSAQSPSWERKDIYSYIGSLVVCFLVSAGTFIFIYSQLKDATRLDYIVILPILIIMYPRWLMGSTSVREKAGFESSVWYQIYGVFVFITSLANVGFKKLLQVISQVKNQEMAEWFIKSNVNGVEKIQLSDECMLDLLSFVAMLSLIGLISYFFVFPRKPKHPK